MMVLLGGLDKKYFPDIDFFDDYMLTNKKFLTWAPREKHINFYQEEYLYFLNHSAVNTQMNVKVKCYYDDDTNSTFNLASTAITRGGLYQIRCGPNNTLIWQHQPEKNLIRYEIWLTNQAATIISEVRTYILLPYKHPHTRYFLFRNSIGGFDTLRITGKAVVEARIEKETIQKHLPMDYDTLDGELQSGAALFRKESDHSSGFLTGQFAEAYQQYLLDFLISNQVYEITNGTRVPVVIAQGSMRYEDDESNQYFVRFRAIESYLNHSFTPDVI
jgi:hypothetical protein